MRVALLAPITHPVPPPGYGPWEQVVADLAEGLSDLGHDVTVFAAGGATVDVRVESVVPHPLEDWSGGDPGDPRVWEEIHIAEMAAQAMEGRFHLVHNHLSVHPLGYAPLLPVPMITTLHGVGWNRVTHPALERYRHLPYVSISDSERRFFPGLDYLATVYNGLSPDRYPQGEGGGGYLVFAGRLAPEKAPHLAIAAASKAGLPIRLAGPVEDKHQGYFEEVVSPSIDGHNVEYLGPITREELVTLYGRAEALLLPLEWDEPFGLVAAESMMTGTPVIGWRRGALPELITNGVTGFLVGSLEESVEAVGRVGEIDRTNCRTVATGRFSADRMSREYEAVYQTAIGPSGRHHGVE